MGALASGTQLSLTVVLAPRDSVALSRFVQGVSTPGSALYRHFLAPGEFGPRFGASQGTIRLVSAALRAAGLSPGPPSSNDLSIPVRASAARVAAALHVRFNRYRLPRGRLAFANTSRPTLAASVAPNVRDIVGLQTVFEPHALALTPRAAAAAGGPAPCAAASGAASRVGAYTVDQVDEGYDLGPLYSSGAMGAGTTVGIYELEPNLPSEISTYTNCFGINPPISYVKVDGGVGSGAGSGEAALDIENVATVAPDSPIEVFQGPDSGNGPLDVFQQMATRDDSQVNTTSWGLCEPDLLAGDPRAIADEETIFEQMAAQGQTLFAAAGDNGSEDCLSDGGTTGDALAVDDPGSQPEVTSVGGTSLQSGTNAGNGYAPGDSTPLAIPPFQTVWNQSATNAGAGGGGVSMAHVWPAYQSGAPASLNVRNANSSATPCGTSAPNECREVPDVSADADPFSGYEHYYRGRWNTDGGTSDASPLWAGILALINSDAADGCTSPAKFGEVNPLLYAIAGGAHYGPALSDIGSPGAGHPANNDYVGDNGGLYPVGSGYDMATGLGTPLAGGANGLAHQLCAMRSGGATPAPVNQAPPSISGVGQQGQTLTEAHGTWTNSPTSFSYQWEDCDTGGNNCVSIASATGQSYSLTSADVGHTIRVQETAVNGGGSQAANSAATGVIVPLAPQNLSPPAVSGNTAEQQTLTLQHGTWTNTPTSISDQWEDCNSSGSGCVPIAGATGGTYTLTAADVGSMIRVQETASNAGGAGTALSAATGVVQAVPTPPATRPSNGSLPVISGTARVGDTLSVSTGTWSGTPPISYAFHWQRCAPGCAAIAGATRRSYKLVAADRGARVRAVVSAFNVAGSSQASSAEVGPVARPTPTASQIRAALKKVLTVSGKGAKIAALLKKGGYTLSFRAPSAGVLVVGWYRVSPSAHQRKRARPVLVAALRTVFHRAGQAKIEIALTKAGRKLLGGANAVKLTAKGSFTPTGETGTTASGTFAVRR